MKKSNKSKKGGDGNLRFDSHLDQKYLTQGLDIVLEPKDLLKTQFVIEDSNREIEISNIKSTKTYSNYELFYNINKNATKNEKDNVSYLILFINSRINYLADETDKDLDEIIVNSINEKNETKKKDEENEEDQIIKEPMDIGKLITNHINFVSKATIDIDKYKQNYKDFDKNEILFNYLNFNDDKKYYLHEFKKKYPKFFKSIEDDKKYSKKMRNIDEPDYNQLLGGGFLLPATHDQESPIITNPLFESFCKAHPFNGSNSPDKVIDELTRFKETIDDTQKIEIDNIIEHIRSNKQKHIIKNEVSFSYYDVDKYNIGNNPVHHETHEFDYTFTKYNYDIITSYELANISVSGKEHEEIEDENFKNMNEYIKKQEEYIRQLSDVDKNIIKDYTNPRPFDLLKEFMANPSDGFIRRYQINNHYDDDICTEFGNAFCDIIFEVFKITDQDIKDRISNKEFAETADDFYKDIKEEDWRIIFQIYLNRLNEIILGAPRVEKEFICFRGSSSDYITNNSLFQMQSNDSETGMDIYLSYVRPTSISISYNAAKKFYDRGSDEQQRTLYRVIVTPMCKILFVSPLTYGDLKEELEFLVPLNHIFASKDLFKKDIIYNNRHSRYNICSNPYNGVLTKDLMLFPCK